MLRADLTALRGAVRERAAVAVIAGLDAMGVEALERFIRETLDGARTRIYWTDERDARPTLDRALAGTPSAG